MNVLEPHVRLRKGNKLGKNIMMQFIFFFFSIVITVLLNNMFLHHQLLTKQIAQLWKHGPSRYWNIFNNHNQHSHTCTSLQFIVTPGLSCCSASWFQGAGLSQEGGVQTETIRFPSEGWSSFQWHFYILSHSLSPAHWDFWCYLSPNVYFKC